MGKRKTLSFAQHQEIAARIKEARKLLMDINLRVSKGLGTSSKPAKAAWQILEKFDLVLKHELDEALYRDCPDVADKEKRALYYGPTTDNKVALLRSRNSESL